MPARLTTAPVPSTMVDGVMNEAMAAAHRTIGPRQIAIRKRAVSVAKAHEGLEGDLFPHHQRAATNISSRRPSRRLRSKEKLATDEERNKNDMLELVNKVEMFRIVTQKVNNQLIAKKRPPVFNLAED